MILKKGEFSIAGGMWSTIQPVDHSRFVGRPPSQIAKIAYTKFNFARGRTVPYSPAGEPNDAPQTSH